MNVQSEKFEELLTRVVQSSQQRQRPSERNLRIADEVRVGGRTQAEVAAEFGVSQRRVSQICQQVDRWFASPGWLRGEPCGQDEERAGDELTRRQLAEIYRRAMRAYTRSERGLVTRKSGERKEGEKWSETSEREQRLDTGSLRVALRAIEQRNRLEHPPVPTYPRQETGQMQYLQWAIAQLGGLRREAEQSGAVPRGPVKSDVLVEQMLRTLLVGEPSKDASAEPPAVAGGDLVAGDERVAGVAWNETPADGAELHVASATPVSPGFAARLPATPSSFSSAEECGLAEDIQGVNDDQWPDASEVVDEHYDDEPNDPSDESSVEISADRRATDEGAHEGDESEAAALPGFAARPPATPEERNTATPEERNTATPTSEPTLALRRKQALARVEYYYGMGINNEQMAEELAYLARWERGCFMPQEQNPDLRKALMEYRRLMPRPRRVLPPHGRPLSNLSASGRSDTMAVSAPAARANG